MADRSELDGSEPSRGAREKSEPWPTIANYPDDKAPEEGAFVTIQMLHALTFQEALLVTDEVRTFIKALQSEQPPQCFSCGQGLALVPGRHPSWFAVLNERTEPNPKADPRRYREALACLPLPETSNRIALCATCCDLSADPNPVFERGMRADAEAAGVRPVSPDMLARIVPDKDGGRS